MEPSGTRTRDLPIGSRSNRRLRTGREPEAVPPEIEVGCGTSPAGPPLPHVPEETGWIRTSTSGSGSIRCLRAERCGYEAGSCLTPLRSRRPRCGLEPRQPRRPNQPEVSAAFAPAMSSLWCTGPDEIQRYLRRVQSATGYSTTATSACSKATSEMPWRERMADRLSATCPAAPPSRNRPSTPGSDADATPPTQATANSPPHDHRRAWHTASRPDAL